MNVARSAKRLSSGERRQEILRTAQPLFAARGLDGVTTREVAKAAGVSEALLYRHFRSKSELYEAVQHSCLQSVVQGAELVRALPDSTSTLVLAVYTVMRNIQFPQEGDGAEQEMPRLILQSLLGDGSFAREFIHFAAGEWISKIQNCIKVATENGDMAQLDETVVWFAQHVAVAIVFYRLPETATVPYPTSDPEVLFASSVRFALRGMGLTSRAIETHLNAEALALLAGRVR